MNKPTAELIAWNKQMAESVGRWAKYYTDEVKPQREDMAANHTATADRLAEQQNIINQMTDGFERNLSVFQPEYELLKAIIEAAKALQPKAEVNNG